MGNDADGPSLEVRCVGRHGLYLCANMSLLYAMTSDIHSRSSAITYRVQGRKVNCVHHHHARNVALYHMLLSSFYISSFMHILQITPHKECRRDTMPTQRAKHMSLAVFRETAPHYTCFARAIRQCAAWVDVAALD